MSGQDGYRRDGGGSNTPSDQLIHNIDPITGSSSIDSTRYGGIDRLRSSIHSIDLNQYGATISQNEATNPYSHRSFALDELDHIHIGDDGDKIQFDGILDQNGEQREGFYSTQTPLTKNVNPTTLSTSHLNGPSSLQSTAILSPDDDNFISRSFGVKGGTDGSLFDFAHTQPSDLYSDPFSPLNDIAIPPANHAPVPEYVHADINREIDQYGRLNNLSRFEIEQLRSKVPEIYHYRQRKHQVNEIHEERRNRWIDRDRAMERDAKSIELMNRTQMRQNQAQNTPQTTSPDYDPDSFNNDYRRRRNQYGRVPESFVNGANGGLDRLGLLDSDRTYASLITTPEQRQKARALKKLTRELNTASSNYDFDQVEQRMKLGSTHPDLIHSTTLFTPQSTQPATILYDNIGKLSKMGIGDHSDDWDRDEIDENGMVIDRSRYEPNNLTTTFYRDNSGNNINPDGSVNKGGKVRMAPLTQTHQYVNSDGGINSMYHQNRVGGQGSGDSGAQSSTSTPTTSTLSSITSTITNRIFPSSSPTPIGPYTPTRSPNEVKGDDDWQNALIAPKDYPHNYNPSLPLSSEPNPNTPPTTNNGGFLSSVWNFFGVGDNDQQQQQQQQKKPKPTPTQSSSIASPSIDSTAFLLHDHRKITQHDPRTGKPHQTLQPIQRDGKSNIPMTPSEQQELAAKLDSNRITAQLHQYHENDMKRRYDLAKERELQHRLDERLKREQQRAVEKTRKDFESGKNAAHWGPNNDDNDDDSHRYSGTAEAYYEAIRDEEEKYKDEIYQRQRKELLTQQRQQHQYYNSYGHPDIDQNDHDNQSPQRKFPSHNDSDNVTIQMSADPANIPQGNHHFVTVEDRVNYEQRRQQHDLINQRKWTKREANAIEKGHRRGEEAALDRMVELRKEQAENGGGNGGGRNTIADQARQDRHRALISGQNPSQSNIRNTAMDGGRVAKERSPFEPSSKADFKNNGQNGGGLF